jgi:predicted unusual protein kinase regulating ubiquinone biosynthesis (AarF/ABC1/UbiB family)
VSAASDTFRRVDALIGVGLRIARSASSGRFALARVAEALDLEWIPRPWGDELAAELASSRKQALEPIDGKRVERLLKDAWGAKPTDELDDLDLRDPVAVTPTSQVHRGSLDGKPVAVKVLRPGLANTVRQDLALLDGLLGPLGAAFPALDPRALMRELRERVLEELDLEQEASAQRRFQRALRGHELFVVPAPITSLARPEVLVSEWIEGIPLAQAPDTDTAAARYVIFVLGGAKAGIVHADPHPDDVLVTADGRLAILDYGTVRTVSPDRAELSAAAVEAFATGDEPGFARAVSGLGWLDQSLAPAALAFIRHALGELAEPGPSRLDTAAVIAARDRALEHDELPRLLAHGALPPEDLWPGRGAAQLFSVIARAGATGDWLALVRRAVRDGWAADESSTA